MCYSITSNYQILRTWTLHRVEEYIKHYITLGDTVDLYIDQRNSQRAI